MRNPPRVFIDLDGVLADFDGHFENIFGMTPEKYREEYSDSDFWKAVHSKGKFFQELPLMPGALDFMFNIRQYRPIILTGVSKDVTVNRQKQLWGQLYLPDIPIACCWSRTKPLFCMPNDMLVDDRIDNVNAWNQAGGIGIRYRPRTSFDYVQNIIHSRMASAVSL